MDAESKPDRKGYNEAIKTKAIRGREIEEELTKGKIQTDAALRVKFNIPPKQRATKQEVMLMLSDVLDTDNKGKLTSSPP